MPNLAQMFTLVNSKTAFSRKDEIYPALSEAGFFVFTQVLKEFSGFFLKFDESTIVLTPDQQEYALPPDLGNLVCLSERQTASENWHQINPESINDALQNTQSLVGFSDWDDLYDDQDSMFQFYGPYLTAADTTAVQTQKIRISPKIDAVRMCQIAYTAKWLPIVNDKSLVMLPEEGTYAMQSYAIAEINRANDDSLSREYEMKGDKHLAAFLTWIRNRQIVKWPTITPYLEG